MLIKCYLYKFISLPHQSVFAAVRGYLLTCMSSEREFGFVLRFLLLQKRLQNLGVLIKKTVLVI